MRGVGEWKRWFRGLMLILGYYQWFSDCLEFGFFANMSSHAVSVAHVLINALSDIPSIASLHPPLPAPSSPHQAVGREAMPRPLTFAVSSFASWSLLANLRDHKQRLVPAIYARAQAVRAVVAARAGKTGAMTREMYCDLLCTLCCKLGGY